MLACGSKAPPGSAAPASSGPSANVVNAIILANGCEVVGRKNAQLAERAMNQLVEACNDVPGGAVQFEATLQPGGHIDIAGIPGQPDMVPICILKHSLLHQVPLTKPCTLDVKIQQMTIPMAARDAGTTD